MHFKSTIFVMILISYAAGDRGLFRENDEDKYDYCGVTSPFSGISHNGGQAVLGEIPWHAIVFMKKNNRYLHKCSGSLVSAIMVLSVATCFWDENNEILIPATKFAVAVGKIKGPWDDAELGNTQKSGVKEVHVPETFSGSISHFADNIAVVLLSNAIKFNAFVAPVCLDFDETIETKQMELAGKFEIASWSSIISGNKTDFLQSMDKSTIENNNKCKLAVPWDITNYVGKNLHCVVKNGMPKCSADVGGGLTIFAQDMGGRTRHFLRGISASPNFFCDLVPITIFTRVGSYKEFIMKFLRNSS